ncbi:Lrp/AsnC family transcriptional regulator [Rhodobacteraceae bacterium CCMM004]|nr:Lrp/AsnC family transcriptional regulator [Rhodobacteraceae bacterium CCMM004]
MDTLDEKILAALAADSSTSTARLGRRFKVARSTVQSRIERLERDGVIAGYTIRLGDAAAVRRIRATVLVRLAGRTLPGVLGRLKAMETVEAAWTTSGRVDLIVRLAATTTDELDAAIDTLGGIDGVMETESLIHLSTRIDRGG